MIDDCKHGGKHSKWKAIEGLHNYTCTGTCMQVKQHHECSAVSK